MEMTQMLKGFPKQRTCKCCVISYVGYVIPIDFFSCGRGWITYLLTLWSKAGGERG